MQGLRYTSRGLRRRNNTDKWEVTLVHKDPLTGEAMTIKAAKVPKFKAGKALKDAVND